MSDDGGRSESLLAVSPRPRDRAPTPLALVETMLARIARCDGALHSFQAIDADVARRAASIVGAESPAGRWPDRDAFLATPSHGAA